MMGAAVLLLCLSLLLVPVVLFTFYEFRTGTALAAVFYLAVSAGCFAACLYVLGNADWLTPLTMPLPAPGLRVQGSFALPSGGDFRLETEVIATRGALDAKTALPGRPPLPCRFHLEVSGSAGFKTLTQDIDGLTHTGDIHPHMTLAYEAFHTLELPRAGGRYTVSLANQGCGPRYAFPGGSAYLMRELHHDAAWFMMATGLVHMIAKLAFVIGLLCAVPAGLPKRALKLP
jgi:hypothetical protein